MKSSYKFAVVLSGCGVYDGAEIQEVVLTLLAINKAGSSYQCFAPDINQHHVINHITGKEVQETRNVLVESARIARGKIKPLNDFSASNFDILIFPGGFGVAKNLSTLAFDGSNCKVNKEVENAVLEMHKLNKPIGALCIAPALMVRILDGANVTIGNDIETIATIVKMKGMHHHKMYNEICIDTNYKLVTNPCYMLNSNISQIEVGAANVVNALIDLVN
ncbi:MAG: isoprenoid biosynthesis glyoxalase ElbB [Salinivirgaceae bacterium]